MTLFRLRQLYRILHYQGLAGLLYRIRGKLWLKGASEQEDCAESLSGLVRGDVDSKGKNDLPLISVVVPLFKPDRELLEQAVQSVLSQSNANFELCLSDDASEEPWLKSYLAQLESDARIKIISRKSRGQIALNTNSALSLATGDWVVLMDQDDLLVPGALERVAAYILHRPKGDIFYSDESKIDSDGKVIQECPKPDWSPLYFQRYMYVGHLKCIRRSLLEKLEGCREGTEGSQDYDLILRAMSSGARIEHIPEVLYHWRAHGDSVALSRGAKSYAYRNALLALYHHFVGQKGVVIEQGIYPGIYRPIVPLNPEHDRVLVLDWGKQDSTNSSLSGVGSSGVFLKIGLGADSDRLIENTKKVLQEETCPYVIFLNSIIVPANRNSLVRIIEELKVDGVAAATGVIADRSSKVVGAGYRVVRGKAQPVLAGYHRFEVGPGMQLATGGDVDMIGLECFAARREDLLEVWNKLPEDVDSIEALSAVLSQLLAKKGGLLFTPYAQFFKVSI